MGLGGDDLDDDFIPDELVALSDGDEHVGGSASDPADDVRGSPSVEEGVEDNAEGGRKNMEKEKKRKRREKDKERKTKKRKLAEAADVLELDSIMAQSPAALYGYLSSKQAKTFSTMSSLELGDMQIPEASIADTTRWTGPRTLDQLVDFIAKGIVLPVEGQFAQHKYNLLFLIPSSSHSSHTTVSEIQVQRCTDTYILDWSSITGRRRDQSSQRQEIAGREGWRGGEALCKAL